MDDRGQDEPGKRPLDASGAREELDVAARIDAQIVAHAFGETANPDDYVPRAACEAVLSRIQRVVFELGEPAALISAPGMGKSLLLRVFARRMAKRATGIELAYGALGFEDLCEWLLLLAGESLLGIPSEDLLAVLERRAFLLTIDDASSLPPTTARRLGRFVRHSPNLGVVLAAPDGYASSRMLAAFGEPLHRLYLGGPMNADEACNYMANRLSRWGASNEMIERLQPGSISRVLRLSGGIPRRIHFVAHEVLYDMPTDVQEQWRDEDWIGEPIDEIELTDVIDEPCA